MPYDFCWSFFYAEHSVDYKFKQLFKAAALLFIKPTSIYVAEYLADELFMNHILHAVVIIYSSTVQVSSKEFLIHFGG